MGGSALFLGLGLFAPYGLKTFYKAWMTLAFIMGWVMTRVILTMTFFLAITPLAFLLRVLGKDLLEESIEPDRETYWKNYEPISDKSRYLNQY